MVGLIIGNLGTGTLPVSVNRPSDSDVVVTDIITRALIPHLSDQNLGRKT